MLVQYTGRLNRASYGKKEIRVYDYIGETVPVLAAMYRKRFRGTELWGLR
jgi:superfamily II DNA or RNA helicase